MERLLRFALRHRLLPRLRAIERFGRDPVGAQVNVLRGLLAAAAQTEWGRRFDFTRLARERDVVGAFQDRVPLHDYDAFRADIARMRRGEADVLWPGRVCRFATSAGTTARGKHLPATDELIRANLRNGAAALLSYLAETGNTSCVRGTPISLTGRVADDPDFPGVRVGEISGLGAEYWYSRSRLRRLLIRRRNIPWEVQQIADWDQKLDAIVAHTMQRDVRVLAMVPSWGLQLFDRLIHSYNDHHQAAATTVGAIWPKVKLIIAGGVPLRAYRDVLLARIGLPGVDLVEVYGASEAPMAFQSSRADPAMMLQLDSGVFFEFVRREDAEKASPRRYTVADVEPGVDYQPVVSTCGGLWAYRIGDVLRFTRLFPHKIMVLGRTVEMLDSYGEFVRGDEAREALRHAAAQSGSPVIEFHVAPRPAGVAGRHAHQWLIEFDQPPADPQQFAAALDERLRQLNPTYDCCRREKGFGPPEVVPLGRGTFFQWLRATRGDLGAQTKIPCMSDHRDLADGVLNMLLASAH
jgi:hypothetical protein